MDIKFECEDSGMRMYVVEDEGGGGDILDNPDSLASLAGSRQTARQ